MVVQHFLGKEKVPGSNPGVGSNPVLNSCRRFPCIFSLISSSAVVGIHMGEYKHAAVVRRSGEWEAERGVLRLPAAHSGFDDLDSWLERQGAVADFVTSHERTSTER